MKSEMRASDTDPDLVCIRSKTAWRQECVGEEESEEGGTGNEEGRALEKLRIVISPLKIGQAHIVVPHQIFWIPHPVSLFPALCLCSPSRVFVPCGMAGFPVQAVTLSKLHQTT